jgi:hypothetical protein
MNELPPGMLAKGKSDDQTFEDDEHLFRGFHPDALCGTSIELDAIELPDMSVNRGKYGPPEWVLLLDGFEGWGVASFQVKDIPRELLHLGLLLFTFIPVHVPLKLNYPHSEVRAYDENGNRIKAKERLDPDMHLRWRECLLQKIHVIIFPGLRDSVT